MGELPRVAGEISAGGAPAEAPALGGHRALLARVETLAGDGLEGFAEGVGPQARFYRPWDVAVDQAGHVFVADAGNHRIRQIAPDGSVSTLAGDGEGGFLDGPGAMARFRWPRALAVDRAGNVYVADTDNHRIRKIDRRDPAHPVVSTFCGDGVRGSVDGARASARFDNPWGIAVDEDGFVYVSDAAGYRVRKLSPGGRASTIAGDGVAGYADGAAAEARLQSPRAVAVDALGNVYVADQGNSRIRRISRAGMVTTVAGDGRGRHVDGLGVAASFRDACGLAVDAFGVLFVADTDNHCIRRIDQDGKVETLAGDGRGEADYADGSGPLARFSSPRGLCVGPAGVVYVADTLNHCIRRLTPA